MKSRGTLFLVVGPSGAGKDSLLDGAREELRTDTSIVFARRHITRPAEAGGEPHIPTSTAEFRRLRDQGRFMLHWEAHGLMYGLPVALADDLAAGRDVVANVSRTVLDEARVNHAPVRIVYVDAPRHLLAKRLAVRGREDEATIMARLDRSIGAPAGADVTHLSNGGSLAEGASRLVALLRSGKMPERKTA